jgi:hypothetical protein
LTEWSRDPVTKFGSEPTNNVTPQAHQALESRFSKYDDADFYAYFHLDKT